MRPIADRHGASVAQVVLAWTVAQDGVTCALAGIRTPEQALENAGAGSLELTETELATIGAAFGDFEIVRPRMSLLGRARAQLAWHAGALFRR